MTSDAPIRRRATGVLAALASLGGGIVSQIGRALRLSPDEAKARRKREREALEAKAKARAPKARAPIHWRKARTHHHGAVGRAMWEERALRCRELAERRHCSAERRSKLMRRAQHAELAAARGWS